MKPKRFTMINKRQVFKFGLAAVTMFFLSWCFAMACANSDKGMMQFWYFCGSGLTACSGIALVVAVGEKITRAK